MIKMDPALLKGKAGRQPTLVGAGPGTEIDDLQHVTSQTAGVNQIVDQLGEEGADRGGARRGVGGDAGGKPARVDGDFGGRFRYVITASAVCCHPRSVARRASAACRHECRSTGSVSQLRSTAARLSGSTGGTAVPGVSVVVAPSRNASTAPVPADTIAGIPRASASVTTSPYVSTRDASSNRSATSHF
jgi:hypothetical protein